MMSLMQAISTMMDAVSSQPTIFPSLEAALLPLLERLTRVEGEDYFEDALELLSYLTYYSPNISPGLWNIPASTPRTCRSRRSTRTRSSRRSTTTSPAAPTPSWGWRAAAAGMLLEMARAALITYSDDQGDADVFGGAQVTAATATTPPPPPNPPHPPQMLEVLLQLQGPRRRRAPRGVLHRAAAALAGENTTSAQARLGVGTPTPAARWPCSSTMYRPRPSTTATPRARGDRDDGADAWCSAPGCSTPRARSPS